MPEETAAARRDGWFHTGDLASRDADGNFFFVGRRKESIRRRGENISAFEIEEVVLPIPTCSRSPPTAYRASSARRTSWWRSSRDPAGPSTSSTWSRTARRTWRRYMVPRYIDVARRAADDAHREGREVPARRARRHRHDLGPRARLIEIGLRNSGVTRKV